MRRNVWRGSSADTTARRARRVSPDSRRAPQARPCSTTIRSTGEPVITRLPLPSRKAAIAFGSCWLPPSGIAWP